MLDTFVIKTELGIVTAPTALDAALLYRAGMLNDPTALAILMNRVTEADAAEALAKIRDIHQAIAAAQESEGPADET